MWVDMGVYVCAHVCVCVYPARGANEPISECCMLSASKPDVIGICHSNGNMVSRL